MAVDESTVSQAPGQPDPDNVEVKIEPPPLPDPSTYPDVEFVYNEIVGSDPKELGSGPPIHFEGNNPVSSLEILDHPVISSSQEQKIRINADTLD